MTTIIVWSQYLYFKVGLFGIVQDGDIKSICQKKAEIFEDFDATLVCGPLFETEKPIALRKLKAKNYLLIINQSIGIGQRYYLVIQA